MIKTEVAPLSQIFFASTCTCTRLFAVISYPSFFPKIDSFIFASETVKESIKKTAKEFLSVMPLFTQRLAQRDYDLILVSPMKRRMLLKMYCMGEFFDNPLAELCIYGRKHGKCQYCLFPS